MTKKTVFILGLLTGFLGALLLVYLFAKVIAFMVYLIPLVTLIALLTYLILRPLK